MGTSDLEALRRRRSNSTTACSVGTTVTATLVVPGAGGTQARSSHADVGGHVTSLSGGATMTNQVRLRHEKGMMARKGRKPL